MNKRHLLSLLEMDDEKLQEYLRNVDLREFRMTLFIAIKEQDRDTRHACAEALLEHNISKVGVIRASSSSDYITVINCTKGLGADFEKLHP